MSISIRARNSIAGLVMAGLAGGGHRHGASRRNSHRARRAHVPGLIFVAGLILVPITGGPYVAQVFLLVGLYVLMGMGLNIELGLAGLLDLGFVAFFATGA